MIAHNDTKLDYLYVRSIDDALKIPGTRFDAGIQSKIRLYSSEGTAILKNDIRGGDIYLDAVSEDGKNVQINVDSIRKIY